MKLLFVEIWMELENMLSNISQTQKVKLYLFSNVEATEKKGKEFFQFLLPQYKDEGLRDLQHWGLEFFSICNYQIKCVKLVGLGSKIHNKMH